MYLIQLTPEQLKRLYYLREELKEKGQKSTIADIVREAVENWLTYYENKVIQGNNLISEKETKLNELDKEYAQKKIAIAKKRYHPEKLKSLEKFERFEAMEQKIRDRNRELSKKLY